ncbi:PAS domain-containing sensor histidine kinase [Clostridium sp. JN-9]|nr:PAS domain-containing sensor histidine kinase [Clostridium sp. JN-9]
MVGFILKYTLKKIFENPFIHIKNNIIIYLNNSFLKLSGYSRDELIGKSISDLSSMLRLDSQINMEHIEKEQSCYLFTKELEPREVTISLSRHSTGNEKKYIIKEISNSRIESRLPFAANLLKDNEIGMAFYSITNKILIKVNNNFLDFLGMPDKSNKDCIGRNPEKIFKGLNEGDLQWIFNNSAGHNQHYFSMMNKHQYIKRAGREWAVSLVPVNLSEKERYIVYTVYDLTDMCKNHKCNEVSVHSEKSMRDEHLLIRFQFDFIKKMIDNLEVGFVRYSYPELKIMDINNRALKGIRSINPALCSTSSVIGKRLLGLLDFDSNEQAEFMMNLKNIKDKKVNCSFDYKKIVSEGEERIIKLVHQPLLGLNNEITEIADVAIDVTEEFKTKKQMEKTIKIQEELFANISHEFKTPLNVIYSTDQLLELYLKNDSLEANRDKISASVKIIKQNCFRFAKLINNIMDLHTIESGFYKLNFTNENIVQVIENVVQSSSKYIKEKGLNIIFDTNTEEKVIACDAGNIERIILNLISNAIKFSKPRGNIFVSVFDKLDTVEITVEDNGIGIEKKHLDKIFGTFAQVDKSLSRNAEGSGIGLSLVKSIVEMHNGKVSVNSEIGTGSKFTIELPARIVENPSIIEKTIPASTKMHRVMVEFSDIY